MQVQLDEEIWEMSDTLQLGEVLATVSDRAQAKGCLVTELHIGNRKVTDRELIPPTLVQLAGSFGSIAAVSKSVKALVRYSEKTGGEFGQQLCNQALQLVENFRQGRRIFRQLDQWFGQMADYLEWLQIHRAVEYTSSHSAQDLSHWIAELVQARKREDAVRLADLLEYEVIPRLTANHS